MYKFNKKIAASLAELLILLAIVGILSVMYQKYVNRDTLEVKFAYKSVLENIARYAATTTKGYTEEFPDRICEDFTRTLNIVGDISCNTSSVPDIPNATTVNGMRFFFLENLFQAAADVGDQFNTIFVDVDGIGGFNRNDKDILAFELMKNGHIRPSGSAVIANDVHTPLRGNPARDPEILSVSAAYVPENAVTRSEFTLMARRLGYAEAQCLTGNPFPYREHVHPFRVQMCIENAANRALFTSGDAGMQSYWDTIKDGSICDNLYTSEDSVARGLPAATDELKAQCKRCYIAAYKARYCTTPPLAADCTSATIEAEKGSCRVLDYVE